MHTAVLDATDMSMFADESFDVVFNMGPFYHLIDEDQRNKCMEESLRVLKKGGLIFIAYISRHYIFQYIALHDKQFLDRFLLRYKKRDGTAVPAERCRGNRSFCAGWPDTDVCIGCRYLE